MSSTVFQHTFLGYFTNLLMESKFNPNSEIQISHCLAKVFHQQVRS